MSECKHDSAPSPDCIYCRCQSKHGTFQCEDDPNHEGGHWYVGGLDPEFAILWDRCPHTFDPPDGIRLLTRCEQELGHGGDHTGASISALDFVEKNPGDPSCRMLSQTVTMRRPRWSNAEGHGAP